MLADQFIEAATSARTTATLDETARLAWRAHIEGHLSDVDAQAVSEAIAARRRAFAVGQAFNRPAHQTSASARRRPSRKLRLADRKNSLERRRRQAASGAMPPAIACRFTLSEQAVLAVIAYEFLRLQICVLPIDAIGAKAGVSRTTVQNAIRQARLLGLIQIRERRIPGQKSLPNVVKVIDPSWLGWLRRGPKGIGFKNLSATDTHYLSKRKPQGSCHEPQSQVTGRPHSPLQRPNLSRAGDYPQRL